MSIDFNSIGIKSYTKSELVNKGGDQNLGQQDFLNLMLTQLKNQDPLSPMDNDAFVAQLAQFSTVSGITEMNGSLGKIAALAAGDSKALAPQWLGRSVSGPDDVSGIVSSVSIAADSSLTLKLEDGTALPASSVIRLS